MSCDAFGIKKIRGDTYRQRFTFRDKAGVAVDLTGSTFAGQLRAKTNDATVAATVTFTIIDGPGGVVEGFIDKTVTATLLGRYVFDYEWRSANGIDVTTFLSGTFEFAADVTR